MLVKTSVARRVIEHAYVHDWPVRRASLHRFDAKVEFGASVDACLFIMALDGMSDRVRVPVYPTLRSEDPETVMGFGRGKLVADTDSYEEVEFADGESPVMWRQGIKHDAAKLMELAPSPTDAGSLTNGFGEEVDVEDEFLYPLMKSTDLFRGHEARRLVIVPQRSVGEDTNGLRIAAPKLWGYLTAHGETFAARRSSIYRRKPPFSIFGVGEYTFTEWKVAISGLHKTPVFRIIGPRQGRPVVFDDTCYLLACEGRAQAELYGALLRGSTVGNLMKALVFPDAKRPITKRLLQRIDLSAIFRSYARNDLDSEAIELLGTPPVWSTASDEELLSLVDGERVPTLFG